MTAAKSPGAPPLDEGSGASAPSKRKGDQSPPTLLDLVFCIDSTGVYGIRLRIKITLFKLEGTSPVHHESNHSLDLFAFWIYLRGEI